MRLAFVSLVVLLSACYTVDTLGPGTTIQEQQELETARAKWEAASIESYDFTFSLFCGECDPEAYPARISVRNKVVVLVDPLRSDNPLDETYFDGVGDLLETVSVSVYDDELKVEVDYDSELGYPTSYSSSCRNANVADCGYSYEITDFENRK